MSKCNIQNFLEEKYDVTLANTAATFSTGNVITTTVAIPLRTYINADTQKLRGRITSLRVLDEDALGISMDVVFMRTNVSLGTVGAAVSISDANAREIIGIVNVVSYTNLITSQQAQPEFKDIPFVLTAGLVTLYVSAVTRGAPTYTAASLRLQVGVELSNQTVDHGS